MLSRQRLSDARNAVRLSPTRETPWRLGHPLRRHGAGRRPASLYPGGPRLRKTGGLLNPSEPSLSEDRPFGTALLASRTDASPDPGFNEQDRLAALAAYAILDTDPEPEFDDVVAMAARACDVPIAYINLLDGRRQWFKAQVGAGVRVLPAKPAICTYAFAEPEILEIRDIAADPRFAEANFVLGGRALRFYAGVALRTPSGLPIGTLCVADHRPRQLGEPQIFILQALARTIMTQLELRKAVVQRDRALAERQSAESRRLADEHRSRLVLDSAIDYAIISADLAGRVTGWNKGARLILGWTEAEMLGEPFSRFFTPEDVETGVPGAEMRAALADGRGNDERWHVRRDGERFWADGEMMALRDESGAVTGFLKILRDRTERRRADRHLRQTRERFDAALASGLLGFLDWDAESGLLCGDGRFASFCGVDSDAAASGVVPERLESRLHADDRGAVRAAIRAALVEGSAFATEFRVAPVDRAGFRWLLLSGHAYAATPERPLRFTGVLVDVTASRMAEAALRSSEELNRRVLASSSDCIKVMTLDGTVQFVNEGGLKVLELDDEAKLVGHRWIAMWAGAERDAAVDAISTATAGGTGRFRGETRTFKGTLKWWDVVVTPILDGAGRPERLLCVSRDITNEMTAQRAREALVAERDAERVRLQAVLDSAPVGIVFAEASGRIVGQNPQADRIFRHAPRPGESVEQHRDWVLYTPDGDRLPSEREPLRRALASGEISAGEEYLYRRGDDTLGWVQLTAAPIRDAAGTITGGVVSVDDIGARKSAEAALRRLNETLEATIAERTRELDRVWRHARDLLCVVRSDGTFLRLNPAWGETLGRDVEEIVDKPFVDFVHPEDRERTIAAMAGLTRGESVLGFENRYRHGDGTDVWFSWNAVPHEGLVYAVVRDVTAEKASAAALAKAEDQLRQSQKMEAVGQLTGGIAHDFNNLLTGITGALDMMSRRIAQGRTGDVARYAKVALASAGRAAALTHRLLAFSRRQPLDPRPTDANDLVQSIEDLLRRTIGEAIVLDVALEPRLPAILCDAHQLENALINLVINARDAMPDGGRVTIETAVTPPGEIAGDHPEEEPRAFVRLTVRDNGRGMTPDVVERAFDPFFTTKPIGQGTGLGLSMIYGFVKQSDGHVRIESAVGRGTQVSLYLPRAEGEAVDGQSPDGSAPARAADGETVLVVEDEPSVRDLVVDVLADLGYRALQAADGPEGVRVLQSGERIDMLVTDVGLPGMNGRQLADQARSLRPGLKVLFITGYAENAIFGEGHLDPGMQMLPKPFSIDALASRLREMIG